MAKKKPDPTDDYARLNAGATETPADTPTDEIPLDGCAEERPCDPATDGLCATHPTCEHVASLLRSLDAERTRLKADHSALAEAATANHLPLLAECRDFVGRLVAGNLISPAAFDCLVAGDDLWKRLKAVVPG